MGSLSITAIMVLVGNLLTDIAYGLVDPRIRYD
jgi:ABC-type dipeptide/oligopeptide/nickel transport system permease component